MITELINFFLILLSLTPYCNHKSLIRILLSQGGEVVESILVNVQLLHEINKLSFWE
jgi:hypothetical protein